MVSAGLRETRKTVGGCHVRDHVRAIMAGVCAIHDRFGARVNFQTLCSSTSDRSLPSTTIFNVHIHVLLV